MGFKTFIRKKILGQYLINKDWCVSAYGKYLGLMAELSEIETLILGPSTGAYGFVGLEQSEFNLCLDSQDQYYSYMLYAKYKEAMPSLKNIVYFYTVFTPGFELEKTSESERCFYYDYCFGIPFKTPQLGTNKKIRTAVASYMKRLRNSVIVPNTHGEFHKKYFLSPEGLADGGGLEKRVAGHLKHNMRNNGQDKFLEMMISVAREAGHKITLVLPPFREDYKQGMPKFDIIFSNAIGIWNKNSDVVILCEAYNNDAFLYDDFGDCDHLNEGGAKKMTQIIRDIL